MDLLEVVRARHSIREYQDRPVEPDKLEAILRAANAAPSAGNLQAYDIVVVRDRARRAALAEAALGQRFIAEAPLVLVFVQDPARSARIYRSRGAGLYCVQDATIACAYAQLAATSVGLGTCWVGAFRPEAVRDLLEAPPGFVPTAILTVGHPAEQPAPTPRRALGDLVHEETFHSPRGRSPR